MRQKPYQALRSEVSGPFAFFAYSVGYVMSHVGFSTAIGDSPLKRFVVAPQIDLGLLGFRGLGRGGVAVISPARTTLASGVLEHEVYHTTVEQWRR